jgi:hypothetical protein
VEPDQTIYSFADPDGTDCMLYLKDLKKCKESGRI